MENAYNCTTRNIWDCSLNEDDEMSSLTCGQKNNTFQDTEVKVTAEIGSIPKLSDITNKIVLFRTLVDKLLVQNGLIFGYINCSIHFNGGQIKNM